VSRTVREELIGVRLAVNRYFTEEDREPRRLDYPKQSAHTKMAAMGTVSLPPTPEDPELDCIGAFVHGRLTKIKKDILRSSVPAMDPRTVHLKSRSFGISVGSYNRKVDRILMELKGYMSAFDDMRKAA